jgi:hypothetical protein
VQGMGRDELDVRIASHLPDADGRCVERLEVVDVRGLRTRIERDIEAALLTFELDRMILEIEVDAMRRWLRNLQRFEAHCAERDRRNGGPGTPPVR